MKCGGLEVICVLTQLSVQGVLCVLLTFFGNNLNTVLLWKLCEKLDYYNGLVLKEPVAPNLTYHFFICM